MLNESFNMYLEFATIESDTSFLNFGLFTLKEKFELKLFLSSLIFKDLVYYYNKKEDHKPDLN